MASFNSLSDRRSDQHLGALHRYDLPQAGGHPLPGRVRRGVRRRRHLQPNLQPRQLPDDQAARIRPRIAGNDVKRGILHQPRQLARIEARMVRRRRERHHRARAVPFRRHLDFGAVRQSARATYLELHAFSRGNAKGSPAGDPRIDRLAVDNNRVDRRAAGIVARAEEESVEERGDVRGRTDADRHPDDQNKGQHPQPAT